MIVGDAAHAMVPFFGQGMNCGFEDILVLDEIFSKYCNGNPSPQEMQQILDEYTITRQPDAEAICELALHNYITMRSSVVDPSYKMRKRIENVFYRFVPRIVMPLYSMVFIFLIKVSFSRIPYAKAWKIHQKRTKVFNRVILISRLGFWATLTAVVIYKLPLIKRLFQ